MVLVFSVSFSCIYEKIIYNSEAVIGDINLKGEKMKQILKYLKEYKKECICAPLFKLLEASLSL